MIEPSSATFILFKACIADSSLILFSLFASLLMRSSRRFRVMSMPSITQQQATHFFTILLSSEIEILSRIAGIAGIPILVNAKTTGTNFLSVASFASGPFTKTPPCAASSHSRCSTNRGTASAARYSPKTMMASILMVSEFVLFSTDNNPWINRFRSSSNWMAAFNLVSPLVEAIACNAFCWLDSVGAGCANRVSSEYTLDKCWLKRIAIAENIFIL